MVPENFIWAFFSAEDYQIQGGVLLANNQSPKDTYYKDIHKKWVKITAVFECIEEARKLYRNADVTYLGPVLRDTKTEVERGSIFPVPAEKQKFDDDLKKSLEEIKLKKSAKLFVDPLYTDSINYYSNVNKRYYRRY